MSETLTSASVLLILTLISTAYGEFTPNVTIRSCSSRSVVVRLSGAADGGIVYIQGGGPDCSRTTAAGKDEHNFDFTMCGLQYDRKFRVVVQKRPHWQTGEDKVVPVMCLVDTSALTVTGVIYPEERSDVAVNKTVRPTVHMAVQPEGSDEHLREVTLNENIKLVVRLDDEYLRDFDIKAKECTAALIPVISDECSPDEELFPNFKKSEAGVLTTSFNAFQPTNLHAVDDVDVTFTCNVAVCKGACEKAVCGEIVGWGRRKRNDDTDDVIERVTIGTKVRVKSPNAAEARVGSERFRHTPRPGNWHIRHPGATEEIGVHVFRLWEFKENSNVVNETSEYCAERVVVTTVTSFTVVTLVFSWTVCGCIMTKLVRREKKQPAGPKKPPGRLRRLSEMNVNLARSVGRRLSTMLHLPFGYDMADSKMMNQIPEMLPTPPTKRRESVTVSNKCDVNREHADDVISVGSSSACILRKRLVSSGSQTDSEFEHIDNEASLRGNSPLSHIRCHNPITSLSIQSFTRGSSLERQLSVDSSPKRSFHDMDEARVYYTADEIPMNREVGLQRQSEIGPDNVGNTRSRRDFHNGANITVINVDRSDEKPMEPRFPNLATLAQNDNVYADIDSINDIHDITSGQAGDFRTCSESSYQPIRSKRRGSASSMLTSLLSTSKKTIGRVADALQSLPNKDKFSLNAGFPAAAGAPVVLSVNREADRKSSMNEKRENNQNEIAKNEPKESGQDLDEHVYEPILFGEQIRIGRKLSTHV